MVLLNMASKHREEIDDIVRFVTTLVDSFIPEENTNWKKDVKPEFTNIIRLLAMKNKIDDSKRMSIYSFDSDVLCGLQIMDLVLIYKDYIYNSRLSAKMAKWVLNADIHVDTIVRDNHMTRLENIRDTTNEHIQYLKSIRNNYCKKDKKKINNIIMKLHDFNWVGEFVKTIR